jgi:hypothetical protein
VFERLAERGLLPFDEPRLAAAHFNWLVMSIPLNRAMFLGEDQPPARDELNRYADTGVSAFPRRVRAALSTLQRASRRISCLQPHVEARNLCRVLLREERESR